MGISNAEVKKKLAEGYLRVMVIIQVVGGPKEHVNKIINEQVDKIKENPNIIILDEDFHEAEPQEKLFLGFVELEILLSDASELAYFCFDYMPSSVEIVEPEKLMYMARDFSAFFNDLQNRLHQLNAALKNTIAENRVLAKNAGLLLRNNVMISLKEKPKDISTLSKNVGISVEQLKPFLEKIIEEGFIKKEGDDYVLKK